MKWSAAETIVVDLTPSQVAISDGETAPVVLAPIIYVASDVPHLKVVAVGQAPYLTSPAIRVNLFGPNDAPPGVSKLDCLKAFFRYALATIVERYLFRMKPTVVIRGSPSVAAALAGYERDLLTQALKSAGVRQVRWSDDPPEA